MHTSRDPSELQQQKLNLILKDYTSKTISNTSLMTEFVEDK
jgi:hypothetical protein